MEGAIENSMSMITMLDFLLRYYVADNEQATKDKFCMRIRFEIDGGANICTLSAR